MTKLFLAALVLLSGTAAVVARNVVVDAGTTSVRNVYDPLLSNYQVNVTASCNSPGECVLPVGAVSQDTLVQHVSCEFALSNSAIVSSAFLDDATATFRNTVPVFNFGTGASSTERGINSDTYLLFKKGATPRVHVFTVTSGPGFVTCTLSGYQK